MGLFDFLGDVLQDNAGEIITSGASIGLNAIGQQALQNSKNESILLGSRLNAAQTLAALQVKQELDREAQLQNAFKNIIATVLQREAGRSSAFTNLASLGQNALR